MNKPIPNDTPASTADAHIRWQAEYAAQIGSDREIRNRSVDQQETDDQSLTTAQTHTDRNDLGTAA